MSSDISHLVHTSVEDCKNILRHATRDQLIAAHRWCEANAAGNKSRKEIIAAALRRMVKAVS
jgi:hypothetical protein